MEKRHDENQERDDATFRVLGSFFAVMGMLVLVGTYEAIGNVPAVVVSVCSGLALMAVGLGMWWWSWRSL